MTNNPKLRIIISGGGTAGHIYPALAVAETLREQGHEILFVGAKGKMEMERVPAAGFEIVGLPIAGLQRKLTLRNLLVPFKLLASMIIARRVIKKFKPQVVAGFGGYASAPILKQAQKLNIPTVIQEQNSYAGLTNRMLARKAVAICTAYDGMDHFFPATKITLTGNPLRLKPAVATDKAEAYKHFNLSPDKQTILLTGGSLGTRTLNDVAMQVVADKGLKEGVQMIWQCGKYYYAEFAAKTKTAKMDGVILVPFIDRMDMAYAIADIVICRAGASTVSELELLGKAAIFVPSPNVAEDHQTKNARALVDVGAGMMIADKLASNQLFIAAYQLLTNTEKISDMESRIRALGRADAARDVAAIIVGLTGLKTNIKSDVNSKSTSVFSPTTMAPPSVCKPKESNQQKVYFIGIGGIGMSALARFFRHEGFQVAGYDRTETPLTKTLVSEGIEVHYQDDIQNIPFEYRGSDTTVIYTPAVPNDSVELNYFRANGNEVIKRSQALGKLSEGKFLQAVAGTHGKTSTTTMAAWFNSIASGEGSAFLGGISKNFGTNMVLGSGNRMVVEADEYDRSFLQLHPSAAVVTAADPDHLDIYGTAEGFRAGFEQFISQIKTGGRVIIKDGVDLTLNNSSIKRYSYSLDNLSTDYYAKNIELRSGGYYCFDIVTPSRVIDGCCLGIPGLINVENCVAAVALVDSQPIDDKKLKEAISSFTGVARRFDFHVNEANVTYMDDYAHHPSELTAMLTSVRKMFPGRHITIAFQPHLYSRTRDFATEFAAALSLADKVLLIPIYPAREEPIAGVTSSIIYDDVTVVKELLPKQFLPSRIESLDTDIVITAGAGDIDQVIPYIKEIMMKKTVTK